MVNMKNVDGIDIPLTQEEEFLKATNDAEQDAEAPRRAIIQHIKDLEAQQTERRIREAVLGIDNGWLIELNNKISDLRSQL